MYRLLVQRGTPFPNPEQLFCDDMIQWHGVLDDVLQGPDFPSGPDPENDQVLAALRQTLDEQFGELFPTQIPGEWTTTTAHGSLWANYRIDERGNLGGSEFPIKAECYRPRLKRAEWCVYACAGCAICFDENCCVFDGDVQYAPRRWAGIDCSGLVQRSAWSHHSTLHDLGGRSEWTIARAQNAVGCSGFLSEIHTTFVGYHPDHQDYDPSDDTYNRVAPGDIIIKSGHVAIVNYVTGERGNRDPNANDVREAEKIHLIQAHGLQDDPDLYGDRVSGRVTDSWRWSDMHGSEEYQLRRLRP